MPLAEEMKKPVPKLEAYREDIYMMFQNLGMVTDAEIDGFLSRIYHDGIFDSYNAGYSSGYEDSANEEHQEYGR